jgi:hypothetical protein
MATLSDAEVLADEINSQARQHPRVSMLLVPQAEIRDDDIVIAVYWQIARSQKRATPSSGSPTTPTCPSNRRPGRSSTT